MNFSRLSIRNNVYGNSETPAKAVWRLIFRIQVSCNFEVITIFSLRMFGLKMSVHSPKWEFWGFDPYIGSDIKETPKDALLLESASFKQLHAIIHQGIWHVEMFAENL